MFLGAKQVMIFKKNILVIVALAGLSGGCAAPSGLLPPIRAPRVLHSIELESTGLSNPDYRYLDFKYLLAGKQIGGFSRSLVTDSAFSGAMSAGEAHYLVGDSFYVKWRHSATGVVYEKTVNFRRLLPVSVEEMGRLYIVVDRETLNLYLASAWRKGLTTCAYKQEISKKNPTPDNRAAAYNCGSLLWKIYPEQRQLNFSAAEN